METNLVWKYEPKQFVAYLRESNYLSLKSHGPIRGWSGTRGVWVKTIEELRAAANKNIDDDVRLIVGYTEVNDHAEVYVRRFWWIRPWDRDICRNGPYATRTPHEAVKPSSIVINCQSQPPDNSANSTERDWNGN